MPRVCRRPPVHPRLADKHRGCKEGGGYAALAYAEARKLQARPEDLTVLGFETVK